MRTNVRMRYGGGVCLDGMESNVNCFWLLFRSVSQDMPNLGWAKV